MRPFIVGLMVVFLAACSISTLTEQEVVGEKSPNLPIDVTSFEIVMENCPSINFPQIVSWLYFDNASVDFLAPMFVNPGEDERRLLQFMRSVEYRVDGDEVKMLWITINKKTEDAFASLWWPSTGSIRAWVNLDKHDAWVEIPLQEYEKILREKLAYREDWVASLCDSHRFQISTQ